jgi:hypothetical protein
MSPHGPWIVSDRLYEQPAPVAWARLGPFSMRHLNSVDSLESFDSFSSSESFCASHRRWIATIFSRDHSPNRVAGRFPDWTAVGFRFRRTPFDVLVRNALNTSEIPDPYLPRIKPLFIDCYQPTLAALGSDASFFEDSLLDTGHAPLAAMLTRIALANVFHASISFGWPHRWPPTSAVPALSCFARLDCCLDAGLLLSGAFSFSPFTFVPDDERNYTSNFNFSLDFSLAAISVIHRLAQVLVNGGVGR